MVRKLKTPIFKTKKKIVTQLKNSNCDKNKKLKTLQDSKTQIGTKLNNLEFQTENKTKKLGKTVLKMGSEKFTKGQVLSI